MAELEPLRALHYDLATVGELGRVIAPPYDVIDASERERLAAASPYNVVAIDLPVDDNDPYARAAALLDEWQSAGALVRDRQPALWGLAQAYAAPDGTQRVRHGLLARVRIEEYGPGRIRPHERTHAGPKEDRLRLTRATRTNLSPIFALYPDPDGAVRRILEAQLDAPAWAEATDDGGTTHRLWRIGDPAAIAKAKDAVAAAELLIADGHHRYETARAYADEVGGEGPHRYVLMCLVALEDPGLTVLPTHRLVRGLTSEQQESLREAVLRDFEVEDVAPHKLAPPAGDGPLRLGYLDAHFRRPFRLVMRDQSIADAALAGRSEAYRRLDPAVVEALLLKGALGMDDDDISHLNGLGYARDESEAVALLDRREYDAAFFLRPTPIERVRAVAAAGENMPPKSTFFHPKVPTGLIFNPLWEE